MFFNHVYCTKDNIRNKPWKLIIKNVKMKLALKDFLV